MDDEGGGNVGLVRCCEGVPALSINIRRKIPRLDDVDAADDDLDNPGRIGVGDKRGTPSL